MAVGLVFPNNTLSNKFDLSMKKAFIRMVSKNKKIVVLEISGEEWIFGNIIRLLPFYGYINGVGEVLLKKRKTPDTIVDRVMAHKSISLPSYGKNITRNYISNYFGIEEKYIKKINLSGEDIVKPGISWLEVVMSMGKSVRIYKLSFTSKITSSPRLIQCKKAVFEFMDEISQDADNFNNVKSFISKPEGKLGILFLLVNDKHSDLFKKILMQERGIDLDNNFEIEFATELIFCEVSSELRGKTDFIEFFKSGEFLISFTKYDVERIWNKIVL